MGIFVVEYVYYNGSGLLCLTKQNDPQNVKSEKNTCWEVTSLRQTAKLRLLSHCA